MLGEGPNPGQESTVRAGAGGVVDNYPPELQGFACIRAQDP